VLTFGVTFVLARFLGAEDFGAYAWALSWMMILRVVVTLGYDLLLVREAAVLAPNGNWTQLRGLVRRCTQTVIGVSLVALPVTAAIGAVVAGPESKQFEALAIGLLGLPLLSLITMRQALAQGLSRVTTSRLPEDLAYPVTFLVLVVGAELLWPKSLDAPVATGLRVASLALALALAIVLVRRDIPTTVGPPEYTYDMKRLAASSIPLVIIGGAGIFLSEFGTIVIGAVLGSAAAGGYAVATKIAFTLTLVEFAANRALSPILARLHVQGDRRRLQSALTKTARGVLGFAALGGTLIAVFANPLLAFFGPEYSGFQTVLRVLVAAWLLNLAGGPCGLLLVMTGRERDAAAALLAAAIASVPLTIWLTSALGPVGAALSTAITMVMWNVIQVSRNWTLWRLDTTALGIVAAMGRRER
jgi:O-antigen/teichoic acid export membrane protein